MPYAYQLYSAARIADFERIAVKADLLRQVRMSKSVPLTTERPFALPGSSISQTDAAYATAR